MSRVAIIFTLLLCYQGLHTQILVDCDFNDGGSKNSADNSSLEIVGGGYTKDRFGNPNYAYQFYGNPNGYINLGHQNRYKSAQTTISMWVKIDNIMHSGTGREINPFIITYSSDNEDFNEAYTACVDMNSKKIAIATQLSKTESATIYANDSIQLNRWYHVAITISNKYLCLYIDGALEGKVIKNFETKYLDNSPIIIGNRPDDKNQRSFNGAIDDIKIFNKAFDENEVLQLYKSSNPVLRPLYLIYGPYLLLMLALVIGVIIIVRIREKRILKKEQLANLLKLKNLDYEIRILKAQMNPHFIFNSLNSILQLIVSGQNLKAEEYLTKFSSIVRNLMNSGSNEKNSLANEIAFLKNYLELEALRFKDSFNPQFNYNTKLDLESVYIPNFIIQPFVENAIWHGLRNKEGKKTVEISFTRVSDTVLNCVICDNGKGIPDEKKVIAANGVNHALSFIKARLELLSAIHKEEYYFTIENTKDQKMNITGVKVSVYLPIYKN